MFYYLMISGLQSLTVWVLLLLPNFLTGRGWPLQAVGWEVVEADYRARFGGEPPEPSETNRLGHGCLFPVSPDFPDTGGTPGRPNRFRKDCDDWSGSWCGWRNPLLRFLVVALDAFSRAHLPRHWCRPDICRALDSTDANRSGPLARACHRLLWTSRICHDRPRPRDR